jgi:hypothetical protein
MEYYDRGLTKWVVLGAALLVATMYAIYTGRDEFVRNRRIYELVVEGVQSGKIATGNQCVVDLPPSLEKASVSGQVYVSRVPSNNFVVVFETWRGGRGDMAGYLYTERPLNPQSVGSNSYGDQVVSICDSVYILKRQVNTNWYEVIVLE